MKLPLTTTLTERDYANLRSLAKDWWRPRRATKKKPVPVDSARRKMGSNARNKTCQGFSYLTLVEHGSR